MILPVVILNIENESDRDFMTAVYNKNYDLMFRVACKYVGVGVEAEDVVSETTVNLIKRLELLREMDADSVAAYINVATTNTALYALRRRKQRNEAVTANWVFDNTAADDSAPDSAILRECGYEELKSAFARLSESDRSVLNMKYVLEYTNKEIAEIVGIADVSVRMRLKRARDRLYTVLKEMEADF